MRNSAQKTNEFRLACENDFSAALGDLRDIADEMDAVAESLLGAEENRAAGEIAAVPDRLAKFGKRRREPFGFPAPFIFSESLGKLPAAKQSQAQIPMRV